MARTRSGTKPPGYDFWGKRPNNSHNSKSSTHKAERQEGKGLARETLREDQSMQVPVLQDGEGSPPSTEEGGAS